MIYAGRFGSWLLLSFVWPATILAAAAPAVSSQPVAKSSIRLPEGLSDAEGRIGYFASAADGIEAVDLANGKVLWHTHEAQRPLLLDGDHLLAQAGTKRNRLRILRLDVKRNGECDFESDPLVFPPWIVTGEAHGHAFAARWHKEKHHLVLDWEASAWYAGKTKPTPEERQSARKHADGIARIDLRSGQIEVLPAAAAGATGKESSPLARIGRTALESPRPGGREGPAMLRAAFVGPAKRNGGAAQGIDARQTAAGADNRG